MGSRRMRRLRPKPVQQFQKLGCSLRGLPPHHPGCRVEDGAILLLAAAVNATHLGGGPASRVVRTCASSHFTAFCMRLGRYARSSEGAPLGSGARLRNEQQITCPRCLKKLAPSFALML